MSNVIKLAQPGFDVKTAGDENLIYSSLWPLLKIYKEGSFTIPDVTLATKITDHDLKFIPMYWFFTNTTINGWSSSGVLSADTRSEFFGPTGGGTFSISDSQLNFTPVAATATGSLQGYYYIFGLDLTKQFTAPTIKTGRVGGSRNGHVFKIAKEGKDVSSKNLGDFVIHSDARSPLIHSVNPSGGVVKTFTVIHNLGYNPMFFAYQKSGASYSLIATGSGGASSLLSDEKTVTFNNTGGQEVTIVILKDPFVIENNIGVTV